MTLIYLSGLALLVVIGFLFGRARAAAADRKHSLHSRPAYHGAFVVLCVLVPMLAIFVIGVPVADRIVDAQAIQALDPSIATDDLKRSAALRDIHALASGRTSAAAVTPELRRAAEVYTSVRSFADNLILGGGLVFGLLGVAYGLRRLSVT